MTAPPAGTGGARAQRRSAPLWRVLARVAAAVAFALVFAAVALLVLLSLPPALGLLWALALGALFLGWHLAPGRRGARRRALVRVRPPRGRAREVALATGATLLLAFGLYGLVDLITSPLLPEELEGWQRRIGDYQRSSPLGWLALASLVAGVIPTVEEFCFRGWVQRSLERRWPPVVAVAVSTLLFAAGHVGGPRLALLLIPLVLGAALGAAAYLFRSIWVPVGIHALWNGAMVVLGSAAGGSAPPAEALPAPALAGLSLALLAAGGSGWFVLLRRAR